VAPTIEEINDLCREIAEETTDITEEELALLELEKQYEFMSYEDEAADADAEYYGVA
jgi:Zn-dependent oligopeptidase